MKNTHRKVLRKKYNKNKSNNNAPTYDLNNCLMSYHITYL